MKLNYKVQGSGETLVFIHGLADSLEYWQPVTDILKEDYQIVTYDLRGHGLAQDYNEITMETYIEDLLAILNELNLKKVNLIGLSLGGAIAQKFTLKYPEKVSSLMLLSTFYKCDEYLTKIFNKLKNSLNNSFEEFYDSILPMSLCPNIIEDNKEELEISKKELSKTANLDAYIKAVDVCLAFNDEDQLHEINVPTLVIAGKYDTLTLLSTQEALQEKINNSELIVLDNIRHNLLIGETVNELITIIRDFNRGIS